MAPSKHVVVGMMLLHTMVAFCVTPVFSLGGDATGPDARAPYFQKPPSESPGFYNYLLGCSQKFIKNCGYLAFSTIVHHNATIPEECCSYIVNRVGKECYDDLIIPILEASAFRVNISDIIASNKQVWDICASIS